MLNPDGHATSFSALHYPQRHPVTPFGGDGGFGTPETTSRSRFHAGPCAPARAPGSGSEAAGSGGPDQVEPMHTRHFGIDDGQVRSPRRADRAPKTVLGQ